MVYCSSILIRSTPDSTAQMQFHDTARFPRGFRCASRNVGLKPTAKDLALFVSDVDAAAAAVFTRNHFPGAPVILGRETIQGGGCARSSRTASAATSRPAPRASRTRDAWPPRPRRRSGRPPTGCS